MLQENTADKIEITYSIGDVVTLKTHPFIKSDISNLADMSFKPFLIQSDAEFIPPICVVIERSKNPVKENEKYDIETGFPVTSGSNYKLLYFNSVTKNYEEKWVAGVFLKKISDDIEISKISINKFHEKKVILKTWKIESNKRKSSLNSNSKDISNQNNIISAHLNFLPPLMLVTGKFKLKEIQEANFDKKTGGKVNIKSQNLLKCQWYNNKNGTFSESIVPAEALMIIEEVPEEIILYISKIIEENTKYIVFERENKILAKPLNVVFNHCEYHLIYEDIINCENNSLIIDNNFYFSEISIDENFAPKIEIVSGKNDEVINIELQKSVEDFFKGENSLKFRMTYINKFDKLNVRTISSIKVIDDKRFSAYCYLRKENRYFRFNRVIRISKLPQI